MKKFITFGSALTMFYLKLDHCPMILAVDKMEVEMEGV